MRKNVCRCTAVVLAMSLSSVAFAAGDQSLTLRRQSVTRTAWAGISVEVPPKSMNTVFWYSTPVYRRGHYVTAEPARRGRSGARYPGYHDLSTGSGGYSGSIGTGGIVLNASPYRSTATPGRAQSAYTNTVSWLSQTYDGEVSVSARAGWQRPREVGDWSDPFFHESLGAQVLNVHGTPLASASGYGGAFDDSSEYADGFNRQPEFRFSASLSAQTRVVAGMNACAQATAGYTQTAFYRVGAAEEYSLDLSMAKNDDVQIVFTIMRWRDRKTVLQFTDENFGVRNGEWLSRSYKGIIQPGVYRIVASAKVQSGSDSNPLGGQAYLFGSMVLGRPDTMAYAAAAPPMMVPEPATAGLIGAACMLLIGRRAAVLTRPRRANGANQSRGC